MKAVSIQITLKINDGDAPELLKAVMLLVRIWAWIERIKCKMLCRTPCQLNIVFSTGGFEK